MILAQKEAVLSIADVDGIKLGGYRHRNLFTPFPHRLRYLTLALARLAASKLLFTSHPSLMATKDRSLCLGRGVAGTVVPGGGFCMSHEGGANEIEAQLVFEPSGSE